MLCAVKHYARKIASTELYYCGYCLLYLLIVVALQYEKQKHKQKNLWLNAMENLNRLIEVGRKL